MREKIESGRFIYNKNHESFYKKGLTGGQSAISQGAIIRKS
ncbi:MAG: hypothetical protein NY202_05805 [Mollicutes bacterium UO1]